MHLLDLKPVGGAGEYIAHPAAGAFGVTDAVPLGDVWGRLTVV
ncbi:hypothetical protein PBAL39_20845 [Pedobacter sp. BAL39]|nr:hypothetical protein PBAL39_20845 [Pedobacter sp. BAL39]